MQAEHICRSLPCESCTGPVKPTLRAPPTFLAPSVPPSPPQPSPPPSAPPSSFLGAMPSSLLPPPLFPPLAAWYEHVSPTSRSCLRRGFPYCSPLRWPRLGEAVHIWCLLFALFISMLVVTNARQIVFYPMPGFISTFFLTVLGVQPGGYWRYEYRTSMPAEVIQLVGEALCSYAWSWWRMAYRSSLPPPSSLCTLFPSCLLLPWPCLASR